MEPVGERWALLIIRGLAVRPQRYGDLLDGLPGISTNMLTAAGHDLEPAIWAVGRRGTGQLGEPRPGEVVTPSAVVMTLRAVFDADKAAGLTQDTTTQGDERAVMGDYLPTGTYTTTKEFEALG
ncbi:winged helix-turn-helix transcriptional regulator [Streptomyces sp. NPDC057616]|uniref:winged helix-turn-helix transcriptional regulator n=1 Tax=Streptomyces sp. NPDC057616 TaxID=3346183 RepID=UPI00369A3EA8